MTTVFGRPNGDLIAAVVVERVPSHRVCCYDRGPVEEKSMAPKDCPMCGETMQIREGQLTDRVPGTAQTRTRRFREWVCPECDYFEEVEDEGPEEE